MKFTSSSEETETWAGISDKSENRLNILSNSTLPYISAVRDARRDRRKNHFLSGPVYWVPVPAPDEPEPIRLRRTRKGTKTLSLTQQITFVSFAALRENLLP